MGQTLIREPRTTSAELIFWLQIHGPSWCMNGLAAPFELYCVQHVKATQSILEKSSHTTTGRSVYRKSCSGKHGHGERLRRTKNGPRMTTLRYFVSYSCTIVSLTWLTSKMAVKRHPVGRGSTMSLCIV